MKVVIRTDKLSKYYGKGGEIKACMHRSRPRLFQHLAAANGGDLATGNYVPIPRKKKTEQNRIAEPELSSIWCYKLRST